MRIVRGAPGTGKTALVFREFKEGLAKGLAPRIVVPTATLVRHFQHELARDGVICSPRSVVSLARFVSELAGDVRRAPQSLMDAILRENLRRLDLPAFADAARTDGMPAVVAETITLFENAGCGPDKLLGIRTLSATGRTFARVWKAVDQDLHTAGYLSRFDLFRAAIVNVKPMHLWFDGFLHFSHLEHSLIDALAEVGQVTVTLPETADSMLFEERTAGVARHPHMVSVAADSMEREADEIARRILHLHQRGTPFREMGIALRDGNAYEPLLRGTLERYGIPARSYFSSPLASHPAFRFLSGLIDCALTGWSHKEALDALAADPRWGHSAAFDRFDFDVREGLPSSGADSLLERAQEAWLRRLEECLSIRKWPEQSHPASEWARRMEQLALRLYAPARLEAPVDYSDVETQRRLAAGLRAWIDAVTEVAELWPAGRGPISLEEYWPVARQAALESSYRTTDERRDVVHLVSVYEARQWDLSALFLCGATNRDYPRRAGQNLLFPDSELEALRRAGIPLRRAWETETEEQELWNELRCRARQEFIVSWPKRDAGGRSVEVSRFVQEADEGAFAQNVIPAGGEPNRRGSRGTISSPDLLQAIAVAHPRMSVTALEDLAQCRFRFFAGRTLRLRSQPERPEERISPKNGGLIMHQALEEWLLVNREGDFVEILEEAFEKACHEMHLPAGFKLEVERALLRGIAKKVSATELWHAERTEAEVEFEVPLTPNLAVTGRMDRIDWMGNDECVIVDYKGGRTKRVQGFIANPAKLQGPFYALAAREKFGLRTIAMMYHAVRDDRRFGWGAIPRVELEDLVPMPEDWIEKARDFGLQRAGELMSGMILAEPTSEDDCRYCDYRDVCHVREEGEPLVQIAGVHA